MLAATVIFLASIVLIAWLEWPRKWDQRPRMRDLGGIIEIDEFDDDDYLYFQQGYLEAIHASVQRNIEKLKAYDAFYLDLIIVIIVQLIATGGAIIGYTFMRF